MALLTPIQPSQDWISGDNGKTWMFDLPSLRAIKRFLKLVATVSSGSTGANITAYILLGKGEITPDGAVNWGATATTTFLTI